MKKIFFLFFYLFSFSFFSQSLSTSLTACYALNGNGTEPISNLTGTLNNVTSTFDRFNNPNSAIAFNGTASTYIALPNSPLLKSTNAVSFSGWVNFNNIIQPQHIVFAHNTCVNYHEGYALLGQNTGTGFKLQLVKSNSSCSPTTEQILQGTSVMTANTWYHIGFYVGNDSLKIYLNGALQATASTTLLFDYDPTANVYLGGTNLAFNHPFNGTMDNVRFYNRKLSGTEFNQLYITDPICAILQTPDCNNVFYSITTNSVFASSTGIPNTSTIVPILAPAFNNFDGFAIGPSLGFPAPNPTFWNVGFGTYYYFDGTTYINTTHTDIGAGSKKYGGSKNFIYSIDQLGQVYAYNGTGNSTLITTVPTSSNGILAADIVGDDLDNFYILKLTNPQSLLVYNNTGTQLCSYSITGVPSPTYASGGGMAIVGNTVTAFNSNNGINQLYYVGIISGPVINFTLAAQSFSMHGGSDFASCPRTVPLFSSTITANPSSSVICNNQTVTLTATSTLTPGSYAWSGPGILTSTNSQTVQVNMSGVYTCTLTSCPMAASIASYTVVVGSAPPTPTITNTNSLSCTSSTAQLSVAPNSLTNTILWNGPGISGPNNTPTININAGGSYSVTLTNTVSGCSATQTINVASSIAPLTLTAIASSTQICTPSAPVTLTVTGATTYTWAPAASLIPSTGSVVAASPTITTNYTVTGTTGVCAGSTAITISVNPTPTLTITGNNTVCAGSSTTLSASGAGSYTWQPGNLTGSTVTVTPASSTTYTITGANGSCTASTLFLLSVLPTPTVTASASPTIICQGNSSTLTANGALTYTWQPVSIPGSSIVVSPLVTTIYTVTGKNLAGCTSNATVQLAVDNPTITVSPASSSICTGQSATLSAAGSTSYTWNPGGFTTSSIVVSPTTSATYTLLSTDGVCSSTNTIPISVNPLPTITAVSNFTAICNGSGATLTASGASTYTWNPIGLFGSTINVTPTLTTTYFVTGTSPFGCVNGTVVTVVVNSNPTITATSNPTTICSGFPSVLTASGALTYTWAPTGANSSTLVITPSVTSTYTVAGTNTIGCVSSQTVSVFVSPTPTVTIVSTNTAICRGNSATLTALGASGFTWQPGALTGATVVVSPTATTVYTVVGTSGICSTTKTFTLVVLPRPNVTVTSLPPAICSGGAALLVAFGAPNFTWSPGSSNGNTLAVTPSVTSTYSVKGMNAVGCTNTAVVTVSVNPNPTITTMPTATSVCSGNSLTLVSSGGVTYLVNPGNLTGPVNAVTPTITTTYTITGINNFGCTASETLVINVKPTPTVSATSSGTLLCSGGTFSLSASGAANYTWVPIGVTGSSVVTTATNAISVYTLIGESGGCNDTSTLAVMVINCNNNVFGMTKAAGKPLLVYNRFYNVDFTVTAVNASSLTLSKVTLNEDLLAAFPAPTNFTVIGPPVVTSQNSSLSVNPLFDGISQISLTSPLTSTLLPNKRDTLVFTVRIDPKGFYGPFKNWVIGFANVLNNVTVADSSNNGFLWDPDHDGDPMNDDSATVINLPVIDLFVPDGFSPNGDGKNDVFFVKGLGKRSIKLTIFNRWGNKVYEKTEYDNTWNGYPNIANTLGSDKVPPATYYYIIEFLDGDKETITGFVVVQY